MRKISLPIILLATSVPASSSTSVTETASPSCPKAFQGIYVGGNIGYAVGGGKQKETDFRTVDTVNKVRNTSRVQGADGGVGIGYLYRLCDWTIGVAFDANWMNTKGTHTRTTISRTTGVLDRLHTKAHEKNSLQLYGRVGYVLREIAMLFAGLGWDNAEWKYRVKQTIVDQTYSAHKNKRLNGLMWKVGVEALATKNIVIGFEYTGSSFNRVRTHKNINTPYEEINIASSIKPLVNKFALTAKFFF